MGGLGHPIVPTFGFGEVYWEGWDTQLSRHLVLVGVFVTFVTSITSFGVTLVATFLGVTLVADLGAVVVTFLTVALGVVDSLVILAVVAVLAVLRVAEVRVLRVAM